MARKSAPRPPGVRPIRPAPRPKTVLEMARAGVPRRSQPGSATMSRPRRGQPGRPISPIRRKK